MIEEHGEKRTITQNVIVSKTCVCDVCKKLIFERRFDPQYAGKHKVPVQWYRVTTGHNDWGNDSVDSVETMHVCSPECLNQVLHEFYDRSFHSNTFPGINNSEYVEIEHEWGHTLEAQDAG